MYDKQFDESDEWLVAAFNKLADDDKRFDEDLQKLKSVDYETQEAVFEGSEPSNDISLRTPDVIKKELKHAKNPMEIKRLNKELTTYYKEHKKCKGVSK